MLFGVAAHLLHSGRSLHEFVLEVLGDLRTKARSDALGSADTTS
jgi:hypothetical protein